MVKKASNTLLEMVSASGRETLMPSSRFSMLMPGIYSRVRPCTISVMGWRGGESEGMGK